MGPKLVDFGVSVDLDVAYFDIQGLKSRPPNWPFWTPPGDLVPEGPNMTLGGSGRRYTECICPCNGPLGHLGLFGVLVRLPTLLETPKSTYFGSQNGSQIGRFRGLRGSRCCLF